jgi:DNA repair exonuclease SbcCD nuclease subunit
VRIIHITDLHLRHHLPGTADIPERLSREMPARFAQAVQQIRDAAPDLLVVGGDLLDYPLDALDDPVTLAQGEKDLQIIAELLDEVDCAVALVHGNHDHPGLMREVFGHYPEEQVCAGHRVICFSDDQDIDNVPRRLGREQERFLQALEDNSLPQIHVQHYPIWPRIHADNYPYNYGESAWLRDQILAGGQVKLVLSGHYHAGLPPLQENGTYFATAPAFAEHPHPYWTYEIEDGEVRYRQSQLGADS